MKLKDQRIQLVTNAMRDILMDSEIGIGVFVNHETLFQPLRIQYSDAEVTYTLRYLDGKGWLDTRKRLDHAYVLTQKGYDEWLFPFGIVIPNSVFISYAKESDKKLAGQLKTYIDGIGFRGFLAHEDIEPTAKWRDRIISDLSSCSLFLALVTKSFIQRQYTEQECGFALALNKRILCICIGTTASDLGFCAEFQAMVFPEKTKTKDIFTELEKQLRKLAPETTTTQ